MSRIIKTLSVTTEVVLAMPKSEATDMPLIGAFATLTELDVIATSKMNSKRFRTWRPTDLLLCVSKRQLGPTMPEESSRRILVVVQHFST